MLKTCYPNIEFVDIAGLVEGANKGEGLGNKFLANIREVDMILQVVRDFSDPNIIREHSKNPDSDTDVINSELILKDLESLEKRIKSFGRDQTKKDELAVLTSYLEHLNSGGLAIDLREKYTEEQYLEYIKPLFLLTDKRIVYVFNVDEDDERLRSPDESVILSDAKNPTTSTTQSSSSSNTPVILNSFQDLKNSTFSTYKNRPVVYINAKLESELSALSPEDQQGYLKDLGIQEAGLDKITRLCFYTLDLISFLTAGVQEVRGWEVKKGSNAVEASGRIHTDFMKNFIKAEVVSFTDLVECKTKTIAKEKGKLRLEGKEYIVKDGDVIEFRIGG